jgi:hypothetical protein
MTYDEIPQVMRHALGAHHGFRQLGFSPDDIFVELARTPSAPPKHIGIFVTLKQPVNKTYRVHVGFWGSGPKNSKRFAASWRGVIASIKSGDVAEDVLERCWRESEVHVHASDFVLGLVTRGMLPLKPRTITLPDGRLVEIEFDSPCVFCGKLMSIGAEKDGKRSSFIAHATPTCRKYDELPPDAFLKATNDALAEARRRSTN